MADHPVSPSDAHFDDEAVSNASTDGPPDTPADDAPEAGDPDAGDPETSDSEMSDLEASEQLNPLQDRLLRLSAEYDNYRRRSVSDRQEAVRQGRASALLPVLEVYDDLRRSLDAAQRASGQDAGASDALVQGVELVFQKFSAALDKVGVTPIEAVGEPFSEELHEAMMQQPAPEDTASGTVLAEIQPGYRLGDRVLRHARVIVAE